MSELSDKMGDSPQQRRMDLLHELAEQFPYATSAEVAELAASRERQDDHGGVAPELEEAGDMLGADGLGGGPSMGSGDPEAGVLGCDHDASGSETR